MTELYLYQIVHLAGGHARNVKAHVALLDASSRELFDRPYAPDIRRLTASIEAISAAEGYSRDVSSFVRICLMPNGEERICSAGTSFYDGYAFRSLQPVACSLEYDLPLSAAPTSAREAVALLARQWALRAGADLAVRCDRAGIFRAADDAPLFGVRAHTAYFHPDTPFAEHDWALRAVAAAGLTLCEEPFGRAELKRLDELFYIDHRGVTALSRCDGQPLMSLAAERVAGQLEQIAKGRKL